MSEGVPLSSGMLLDALGTRFSTPPPLIDSWKAMNWALSRLEPPDVSKVPWQGPVCVAGIVVWLTVKLPLPVRVIPPSTTTLPFAIVTLLPLPSLMPPGPQSIHQLPETETGAPGVHE